MIADPVSNPFPERRFQKRRDGDAPHKNQNYTKPANHSTPFFNPSDTPSSETLLPTIPSGAIDMNSVPSNPSVPVILPTSQASLPHFLSSLVSLQPNPFINSSFLTNPISLSVFDGSILTYIPPKPNTALVHEPSPSTLELSHPSKPHTLHQVSYPPISENQPLPLEQESNNPPSSKQALLEPLSPPTNHIPLPILPGSPFLVNVPMSADSPLRRAGKRTYVTRRQSKMTGRGAKRAVGRPAKRKLADIAEFVDQDPVEVHSKKICHDDPCNNFVDTALVSDASVNSQTAGIGMVSHPRRDQ